MSHTEDEMAVRLLYAWNNVDPASGVLSAYKWPDGFPEGSREGWRRVMRAAQEFASPSSNGRTPHFDCGNEGSSPSGELTVPRAVLDLCFDFIVAGSEPRGTDPERDGLLDRLCDLLRPAISANAR